MFQFVPFLVFSGLSLPGRESGCWISGCINPTFGTNSQVSSRCKYCFLHFIFWKIFSMHRLPYRLVIVTEFSELLFNLESYAYDSEQGKKLKLVSNDGQLWWVGIELRLEFWLGIWVQINPPPHLHPQEWKRKLLMEILDLSKCTSHGVWRLCCTPEYYRVVRSVLNGVSVIRQWLDLTGNPSKSFDGKFSLGLAILFLNGQMHCIASCGIKYPPFDGKNVLGKKWKEFSAWKALLCLCRNVRAHLVT